MFLESLPNYEYIGLPKPKNDEDIENLLNEYGKYIKTPKSYAGDIEIALTSLFFCVKINITILDNFEYKNYLYYKGNVETDENINIILTNNNENDNKKINEDINEFLKNKIKLIKNNKKLKKLNFNNIENKIVNKYNSYNSSDCPDKYNEIFNYLKNKSYIPPRLYYIDKKNIKKFRKKVFLEKLYK